MLNQLRKFFRWFLLGDAPLGAFVPSDAATSTFRDPALSTTAVAVKASAGSVVGYNIFNPGSALAYVHFYDVAQGSVTVGTTVPKLSLPLPSNSSATVGIDSKQASVPYSTAITVAASTTPGGSTAPGTALVVNILYN